MRPIWLLEANVLGLPSERLQEEIRRQGMQVRPVKYLPHAGRPGDIAGSESVPHDACVLFMGTLPLMRHIRSHRRWRPGGFCNVAHLSCSWYYAWFGEFMLNRRYALLPVAEVLRSSGALFETYGRHGEIFVRPDTVEKTFAGKLVDEEALPRLLAPVIYDPTVLVLIAQPCEIGREWRLIVRGDDVVTSSLYRDRGESVHVTGCPEDVFDFVSCALGEIAWRPDPIFVMDVCETASGLRIVELNSFSCSGPYQCDLRSMVEAASDLAVNA